MTTTREPRCACCGAAESDAPVVPDDNGVGPGSFICAVCFMQRVEQDPDVRFFLFTIERQIPEAERLVRMEFHHTVPEWIAAVKSLTRIQDMRRFADGCALWHTGPSITAEEAALITADNIGCVLQELGWFRRLKWWWATGITRSRVFHS